MWSQGDLCECHLCLIDKLVEEATMKINLTKLLESPTRVRALSLVPDTALFIPRWQDETGERQPYSFEIEEET